MRLQYYTYIPTIIGLVILAAFIGFSNFKARANRSFVVFISGIILWATISFVSDVGLISNHTFASKLIYASAAWLPLLLLFFMRNFLRSSDGNIKDKNRRKIELVIVGSASLVLTILALSNLTVVSAEMGTFGVIISEPGPLLTAHILFYLAVSIYAYAVLLSAYRKSTVINRNNALLFLVGLTLMILINIVVNGLLILVGNSDLGPLLGTPSVLIFTLLVASSIVTHGLFDVRLIVARSLTYLLSIFTIGFGYILFAFTLSRLFFVNGVQSSTSQVVNVLITLVLVFTFPPIKKFFDRLTSKLFYRDAYETQVILDKVSGIIVGSVDPRKVQKGALSALFDALKPTYMTFLLLSPNGRLHQGDVVGQHWRIHESQTLGNALKKNGKKIVFFDELEDQVSSLRDILRIEDISVVSPLVTKDETIGYLILGPKKSGNIYNTQDVGLLNIASNELAVALQNAQRFEEIQAFNITLQQKVTEATREVKKTNRKLVALDEAKDEFISMASHQLRTPLTSIKGYLSMMVEGDLGKVNAAQEKALKEAFGSSQRMVYLIADFLNVSRIKTGKFVIETKEVDLPQVVGEEITQLREMAASREITLQYEAPGVFPRVKLDDNKIRQVMMNMVDNAIYYTPSGGMVTIQLYVDARDVVFKVVDTGIGVPKREQHKLFTKFFRAGNARKARPDGTGLGLFMAQKIIVEQGGSIIFESTEGKGSTFGFRFPLSTIKS